jgi:hypothetical protein
MELEKFDDLTRAFSGTSTRRRFGGFLAAVGLGTVASLGLLGAADTDAKKRHKKRNRKRNKHNGGGTGTGTPGDGGNGGGNGGGGGNGDGGGTGPIFPPICIPDCEGVFGHKYCGSDGCGGTCGQCPLSLPICNNITFTCGPLI